MKLWKDREEYKYIILSAIIHTYISIYEEQILSFVFNFYDFPKGAEHPLKLVGLGEDVRDHYDGLDRGIQDGQGRVLAAKSQPLPHTLYVFWWFLRKLKMDI